MASIATTARATYADLSDRAREGIHTGGELVLLAYDSVRAAILDIISRKFSWQEFLLQAWFMVRVSLLPTILVAIPFGVIVSIQIGGIASQIGASSFVGAVNGIGVLRQGAPLVTSLMIAGAVGSAITADLGARQVREEIDAMKVMGLDPVRRLVSPRVVAAIVVAALLSAVVATTAIVTGFALTVGSGDVSSGTYLGAFISFGQPTDLALAELKAVLFGFIATIVAAHKGLHAKGGPKGVADAVNQSVVLSVILLALVNVGLTQAYVMLVPQKVA
ncbi:MlaE family ABC transporter permease [Nocardioides marmoribigeumensis]|jgi:phospholipid/cholesterol/gamma-HCH transport system permease protein|uniref:Phospholipid/cholesterol/gamma-HCH transport system permease protein n=1 Tax=Nocardioides marmoribigeumensis TaxID=433649 RepID=A0ABU2BR75_9ACTN|nr:ABC transporter permease [Nocardioides marmoribigeumensis]MDR7361122.1 phospholipid/cholesterol/gamma-HCH transport system permease protein [Nocardioides marmoribigeumensis]